MCERISSLLASACDMAVSDCSCVHGCSSAGVLTCAGSAVSKSHMHACLQMEATRRIRACTRQSWQGRR